MNINTHKVLLIAIISMVILAGFLTILKLWFPMMDSVLFFKIIGTLGILTVLAALVLILKADLGQQKNLKDNNYID